MKKWCDAWNLPILPLKPLRQKSITVPTISGAKPIKND